MDILKEYELAAAHMVSAVFDNCSVMHGATSGVEARLRTSNPFLLDVSGDTVHMMSNASKRLLVPFDQFVEKFAGDVYHDIEQSPRRISSENEV